MFANDWHSIHEIHLPSSKNQPVIKISKANTIIKALLFTHMKRMLNFLNNGG